MRARLLVIFGGSFNLDLYNVTHSMLLSVIFITIDLLILQAKKHPEDKDFLIELQKKHRHLIRAAKKVFLVDYYYLIEEILHDTGSKNRHKEIRKFYKKHPLYDDREYEKITDDILLEELLSDSSVISIKTKEHQRDYDSLKEQYEKYLVFKNRDLVSLTNSDNTTLSTSLTETLITSIIQNYLNIFKLKKHKYQDFTEKMEYTNKQLMTMYYSNYQRTEPGQGWPLTNYNNDIMRLIQEQIFPSVWKYAKQQEKLCYVPDLHNHLLTKATANILSVSKQKPSSRKKIRSARAVLRKKEPKKLPLDKSLYQYQGFFFFIPPNNKEKEIFKILLNLNSEAEKIVKKNQSNNKPPVIKMRTIFLSCLFVISLCTFAYFAKKQLPAFL